MLIASRRTDEAAVEGATVRSFRLRGTVLAVIATAGLMVLAATMPAAAATDRPAAIPTLTLPPVPTKSVPTTPPPDVVPAHCADGAITGHSVRLNQAGNPVLSLSGWIQPCPEGSPTHYAIIWYDAGSGTAFRYRYQSLTAPTQFAISATLGSTRTTAVCLAYDRYARLSCLAIDYPDGLQSATVTPIPVDDSRVLVPVGDKWEDPDQTCGTCA
jgi:hypothetical protein